MLVGNAVYRHQLRAEHGLAFHVQAGTESLLFDTGQSDLVVQNARELSLDLSRISAVALSHGHYDHTGGLRAVWEMAPHATLHAHVAALGSHFVRYSGGLIRDVGITKRNRGAARAFARAEPVSTTPAEVVNGVFLTGEIPRETDFEDAGGPFLLDETGTQPDPINDDQALFFDTPNGAVVLLGCAHAGVVNTLRQVQRLLVNRPIHAVIGGMHLLTASEERMERTVAALREISVQCLVPAHCTGASSTRRLWQEFPTICQDCAVGSQFVFQRSP